MFKSIIFSISRTMYYLYM